MYNKLFTKILDSSIWLEPTPTRIVFVTLLAAMDEDGFCSFASPANVAHRAVVSLSEATAALETLEAPDPNSSDPSNEGRRIERIPGGWYVLNAPKYREVVSREESKRLNRDRQKRHYQKKQAEPNANLTPPNANLTVPNVSLTQSEAYTEAEAHTEAKAERESVSLPTQTVAPYRPGRPEQDSIGADRRRHLNCIGSGNWWSCIRGRCVPVKLVKDWQAQGFSEEYIQNIVDNYITALPDKTPLPSDGFKLWGGVWDSTHGVTIPSAAPTTKADRTIAAMRRVAAKHGIGAMS